MTAPVKSRCPSLNDIRPRLEPVGKARRLNRSSLHRSTVRFPAVFGNVDVTPSWCTTAAARANDDWAISNLNGWDSPGPPASNAGTRRAVPQPAHLPHPRPSIVVTRVHKGGTEPIRTTHRPNRHAGTEPRPPRQPGRCAAERAVKSGRVAGSRRRVGRHDR